VRAFRLHTGLACPIDAINVDTDQILPARFLQKRRLDPSYQDFLFYDLRFSSNGVKKFGFPLNKTEFKSASILVCNSNFGGGSSREAAAFALDAFGIRCVIAPNFGDIFYANCIKNGILPIVLSKEDVKQIRGLLHEKPGTEIQINLKEQLVICPSESIFQFTISEFDKTNLLTGLSQIGLTMKHVKSIDAFEKLYRQRRYWVNDAIEVK